MSAVSAAFRLVAGLGNTGKRYAGTRHNAGFQYADALAERLRANWRRDRRAQGEMARAACGGRDLRLLKPTTLMNRSGLSVAAVTRANGICAGEILVAHDEIDLPPGRVRLKFGGGHGGNNGVRDVATRLGTADFWRLRIGVGKPAHRDDVIGHVLTRPAPDERRAIAQAIDAAIEETQRLLGEGDVEGAMNALHTRD